VEGAQKLRRALVGSLLSAISAIGKKPKAPNLDRAES
jgi:hypothetical protein